MRPEPSNSQQAESDIKSGAKKYSKSPFLVLRANLEFLWRATIEASETDSGSCAYTLAVKNRFVCSHDKYLSGT